MENTFDLFAIDLVDNSRTRDLHPLEYAHVGEPTEKVPTIVSTFLSFRVLKYLSSLPLLQTAVWCIDTPYPLVHNGTVARGTW